MILPFNFKKLPHLGHLGHKKPTLDPVAWDPLMEHFKFETNSANAYWYKNGSQLAVPKVEPNSGKIMKAHSAPKMDAKLKIKYVLCKSCQKCAGLSHRK